VRRFKRAVRLTLVGTRTAELESCLAQNADHFVAVEPQTKQALRRIYCRHDVLVLPSLVDSFGFVGLEAMACGLPIVVTENCGVPVPDPAWRVPVMDSRAIAGRIEYYLDNPDGVERDGSLAQHFAKQFNPELYRERIRTLFRRLLAPTPSSLIAACKSQP
jgi:glycosyltransferase involved in cell wall biosynthesis